VSFLATWLPFGQIRAPAAVRAAALATPSIEMLIEPGSAPTLVAGGYETKGALPHRSAFLDAALYSSRGRGYAPYNEDAAGLFTDARGHVYAFVLDQAGGLGGHVRGAASALAAEKIWRGCRAIATGEGIAHELLAKAFAEAHELLVARREGEVTTAVAAVATADEIELMSSGDSAALHYDRHGALKAATALQELAPPNIGCLSHAIGLVPEGHAPDAYSWELEAGDWILLATDGLLDAGLDREVIGAQLVNAHDAEDAVNALCTRVLRRMATLRAKPDNLTVVAIRRPSV